MNTHLTTSTLVMVVAVTFYACFLVPRLGRVLAVLLLGGISAFEACQGNVVSSVVCAAMGIVCFEMARHAALATRPLPSTSRR